MGRHQVLRRKDWRDDSVLKSTCQSCGGPSLVAQHQQGSSQSFSIPTIGDPTPSSGLRWQRMHLVYYIQAKRKTKINLIKKYRQKARRTRYGELVLGGDLRHEMEEMEVLRIQRVCASSRVAHISSFQMMLIRETLREVSADGDRMAFPSYANGLDVTCTSLCFLIPQ